MGHFEGRKNILRTEIKDKKWTLENMMSRSNLNLNNTKSENPI